jgi:ketosteroid isomerase-like protein
MTRDEVQGWLDRYVEAWRSYDADAIGELFADDATYAYHPYDAQPLRGRAAIVAGWRGEQDEPGSWEARYEVSLLEGDRAIARGETRYASGPTFSNLFELRFDDAGRCAAFVEWYMEQPRSND